MTRRLLALACAAATALPAAAWAQDLLTVWRAAAGHDRQLAVARAEHGATQTLREQADALGRPSLSLAVGAGLGAQDTAMRGARFSAPGMGPVDEARFATSVDAGLATRVAVVAQQPLVNAARDAQRAQLRLGADMGDTAWRGAQSELMLRTAERYLALAWPRSACACSAGSCGHWSRRATRRTSATASVPRPSPTRMRPMPRWPVHVRSRRPPCWRPTPAAGSWSTAPDWPGSRRACRRSPWRRCPTRPVGIRLLRPTTRACAC
ncbi:hypothetical protein ACFSTJ_13380 [Ottowia pentelensis]|uniref:hypothetical protein n=1 Tax=Ottowia pentelensis TaxID=511108 RepID=UPI00363E0E9F